MIDSFLLLLFSGWGVRVYYVNLNAEQPRKEVYEMNKFVNFENNFIMDSSENLNGYSINVMEAKIKSYAEYVSEYREITDSIAEAQNEDNLSHPSYVYDIVVCIKNTTNNKGGINLFLFKLQTDDYYLQVDQKLWELSYPKLEGAMSSRLLENTSLEFHLPFVLTPNIEREFGRTILEKRNYYLVISEYPMKQMIEIKR